MHSRTRAIAEPPVREVLVARQPVLDADMNLLGFELLVDGAEIRTIEGMAGADGALHPLQEAFWNDHALQCGYCTPGMIMAAADLLNRNPNPSEEEIRQGLEGNLCRCTGYHNIVRAVQDAAKAGSGGALQTPTPDQEGAENVQAVAETGLGA